jgi:hypothetical protein
VTLDDGASPGLLASNGQEWSCFSDQVMGGQSSATLARIELEGRRVLRLAGVVRLENRGGFIQMALPLAPAGQALDASGYHGISIAGRASVGDYFVHLRTLDTIRPWQHYQAPLPLREEWREVVVPFSAFLPRGLEVPLDRGRLTRIGLVAGKSAFTAELLVAHVSLSPERNPPSR